MPGEPEGESQLQPKPPAPTNTPPEVRGILPHEPNPTEPKLPPQLEEAVSDAGRVIGAGQTDKLGSSHT